MTFIIHANEIDGIDKKNSDAVIFTFYEFTFLRNVSFAHFPLAFIHDQNLS